MRSACGCRGTIRIRSSTKPGKSWTAVSVFLPANEPPESARERAEPLAVHGVAT